MTIDGLKPISPPLGDMLLVSDTLIKVHVDEVKTAMEKWYAL